MLVIFQTKSYPEITMFGDVAVKLLQMMGHSGTVPGAVAAEDVPAALDALRGAVAAAVQPAEQPGDEVEGNAAERPVSLSQRAFPLLEMLEAAAADQDPVMWDKG